MSEVGAVSIELTLPRWARALPLGAFTLIVAQLVWRAAVLSRFSFVGDDVWWISTAFDGGFAEYVTRTTVGHFLPVGFAVTWVLAHVAPYDWTVAMAVLLGLQLAASLAVLRLLRTVLGDRPWILVPFAFYVFSPMTFPAFTWWAAAIETLPLQIALASGLNAHIRYLREGRLRHGVAAAAWFLLGLASFLVKAALAFPLLVVFFSGRRRPWRAYALYGGVLLLTAAVYALVRTPGGEPVSLPGLSTAARFTGTFLGTTLVTSLVGGPGSWFGSAAAPAAPFHWIAAGVLLALVALSVTRSRPAWRAWTLLLTYVAVVDLAPLLLGRATAMIMLSLEVRYLADAAVVAALCLGLAFQDGLARHPKTAVALTAVFAVVSFVTVSAYVDVYAADRRAARAYLDTVRATMAHLPPGTDLYPREVPATLVPYFFIPPGMNHTSKVLAPLAGPAARSALRRPRPSLTPKVIDDTGHVSDFTVLGAGLAPPPGRRCMPDDDGVVTGAVTADGAPGRVGGFAYVAEEPTRVEVAVGEERITADLPAGAHSLFFPVTARAGSMKVTPARPTCLIGMVYGTPIPLRS
ncbi:hypothetical protein [Sphaerisporangium fuscum]|uniref:hypothetical protein n=1 Tax=Sphaerisporangium fuscum TaxID=2835868 RepID=UPI001BDC9CD7|nr:hypothetical protein [Sphaerisporangium fuscum]